MKEIGMFCLVLALAIGGLALVVFLIPQALFIIVPGTLVAFVRFMFTEESQEEPDWSDWGRE